MTTIFADYSRYYNLIYHDKDYTGEVDFVLAALRRHGCAPRTLLDLGCGTGRHAAEFAHRGIAVTGVDLSETMLSMGKDALAEESLGDVPSPVLLHGDACSIRLNTTFDAVVSLFHVLSYQDTEKKALALLSTANMHLNPYGMMLVDYWYGPGVLSDPPVYREKILENDDIRVFRKATPVHRVGDNVVEVHYTVNLQDKRSGTTSVLEECHTMRYWFLPELRYLAGQAGFSVLAEGAWLTTDKPDLTAWNAWCLFTKDM